MLGPGWTAVVALAAAYVIAVAGTPAGISGAVLLLPFQVSVLGTPSPAVTPTNLLYNVIATPGALFRYWRQRQTGGSLAGVLIAGTVPGAIAGSVIRVELLPGARVFDYVVAAVLLPIGCWLALTRPPKQAAPEHPGQPRAADEADAGAHSHDGGGLPQPQTQPHPDRRGPQGIPMAWLVVLAAAVGCVGEIIGIGGGSILAPVLIGNRQASRRRRPGRARVDVRDVGGRRDHVRAALAAPPWLGRAGLAHRSGARHRRPGRR